MTVLVFREFLCVVIAVVGAGGLMHSVGACMYEYGNKDGSGKDLVMGTTTTQKRKYVNLNSTNTKTWG
jgi:hypothetical protein